MVVLDVVTPAEYAETQIFPTLTKALVALSRERPEDPVTFLAQYLLDNKPVPPAVPARTYSSRSKVVEQEQSMARLNEQFSRFDTDGSGDLDIRELAKLLSTVGLTLTEADVGRLLAQYDEDNSGTLSEDEFLVLAQRELALAGELSLYAGAFKAVDMDGSGEIDVREFRALLDRLGYPCEPKEVETLCANFDADGNGKLSFDEFLEVVKTGLVDASELRAAFQDSEALADAEEAYELLNSSASIGTNSPGYLVEAMCKLISEHGDDLEHLSGTSELETLTIRGVLVKLVRDLVRWEEGLDRFPAESLGRELLKEVANERGWAWKNAEGGKEDSFKGLAEWYSGLKAQCSAATTAELMVALVKAEAPTVGAMSTKFGNAFDDSLLVLLAGIISWDSKMLDAEGILALDEPAIFAFSFGTGDKIGPALEMPTKVGPGCETPGKTNEGLAESVRAILAVRPMPVYAQWEIADALLHGPNGHPSAESFARWEFGDSLPGGDPSQAGRSYARVEPYTVPGSGVQVAVHKSLPIWPLALRKRLVEEAALADGPTMKKFYLSTVGVLQQNADFWAEGSVASKPKSVLVVGQLDHGKRCGKLVRELVLPAKDGGPTKQSLGLERTELPSYYTFSPADWSAFSCDQFGYDPVSTQKWTRNRALFVAHEATARGMQYVREDFGPMAIHKSLEKVGKGRGGFVSSKLASKDGALTLLLAPKTEW